VVPSSDPRAPRRAPPRLNRARRATPGSGGGDGSGDESDDNDGNDDDADDNDNSVGNNTTNSNNNNNNTNSNSTTTNNNGQASAVAAAAQRPGLRFRVSRHRYHRTAPITVLDPMTNTEIVGEVMYYRFRRESAAAALAAALAARSAGKEDPIGGGGNRRSSNSAQVTVRAAGGGDAAPLLLPGAIDDDDGGGDAGGNNNAGDGNHNAGGTGGTGGDAADFFPAPKLSDIGDLHADFIGTDYSFVHSESVRDAIALSALDAADARIGDTPAASAAATAAAIRAQHHNHHFVPGAHGDLDGTELISVLQRLAPMIDAAHATRTRAPGDMLIDVPYARCVVFGAVGMLYLVIAFLIFASAALHLMARGSERGTYWYFIFLIPLSFATDHLTSAIFMSLQRRDFVVGKILIGVTYVLLPLILSDGGEKSSSGSSYWLVRDLLDVIVAPACVVYSCGLYIFYSIDKRLL
jgi:hypothetical protein